MKIDFFKVVAIVFLIAFFSLLVYYGFKEPPDEVIEEVKRTNPIVQKKVEELMKEDNDNTSKNISMKQDNKKIDDTDNNSIPLSDGTVATAMQSVNEIVEKNKRVTEMIQTYKNFQINYLRYQQVTSGEKFPDKGIHLKGVYEEALQKLLSFTTEDDYKFLLEQGLNEWRPNVKNYFFNKLSEIQNDIKDRIILEKLPKLSKEENILFLLKGLSKKLSPDNKERIINIFSKIRPEFNSAKKEIQNIISKQQ